MKYIFLFILINFVHLFNGKSLRLTRKKFLFRNPKPYISISIPMKYAANENNMNEDYEIPEWVNNKVFKYNKKDTIYAKYAKHNSTKY
jgi:hypothetical protein